MCSPDHPQPFWFPEEPQEVYRPHRSQTAKEILNAEKHNTTRKTLYERKVVIDSRVIAAHLKVWN